MEYLEDIAAKDPKRVKVIKKARVTKVINENGNAIGVEYEKDGKANKEFGPVVISTGGYAADFTDNSLLKKHRPELWDLPTTNGDHSTGDGIKMALAFGSNSVDLDKVQVHPTGLVDPKDPNAKVKFLAAEALRGCGGILLDANGNRFCDELGHRDYVTGEMWKNKGPFRLILNGAASREIEWHCKHYVGRGLMKRFSTGAELAREMGISVQKLADTFRKYNDVAKNGGDPFGKKFFHNTPLDTNDFFHVAIVTPVLHFTMGGLEINDESEVLGRQGPIPGLFAAGEVAGGVHGTNRLGGSSLLGCVVYGRVAGRSASRYLLSRLSSEKSGFGRSSGSNVNVNVSPDGSVQVNVSQGGSTSSVSQTQAGSEISEPAPVASTAASKENKQIREITVAEVAKHKSENDCWVIINGQVLDVTKFLPDHPGGKKAILLFAGKEATEEFNMLHKPDVIEKYAPETVIGYVAGGNKAKSSL